MLFRSLEVVLALGRFAGGPVDPRADGIEAKGANLADILAPGLLLRAGVAFEHWRAGLASAIPDRHREELSRFGRRQRHAGEKKQKNIAKPGHTPMLCHDPLARRKAPARAGGSGAQIVQNG